jgi:hypothetical protein
LAGPLGAGVALDEVGAGAGVAGARVHDSAATDAATNSEPVRPAIFDQCSAKG